MSKTRTADTSVVVPALSEWHEAHDVAWKACLHMQTLPAHVVLETLSVLTRLPSGLAIAPQDAMRAIRTNFPNSPLNLPAREHQRLAQRIADIGLRGGQVYDALVAATADHAGAQLLTRDKRAETTYQRSRADYVFVT